MVHRTLGANTHSAQAHFPNCPKLGLTWVVIGSNKALSVGAVSKRPAC